MKNKIIFSYAVFVREPDDKKLLKENMMVTGSFVSSKSEMDNKLQDIANYYAGQIEVGFEVAVVVSNEEKLKKIRGFIVDDEEIPVINGFINAILQIGDKKIDGLYY